jgi:hypothetical protein
MRHPLLYAGCVMFALTAGTSGAMAQSDFLDSEPTFADPVPLTKPLFTPASATAESAVESPSANTNAHITIAHPGRMLACSQVNPCAIATPLVPGRGS